MSNLNIRGKMIHCSKCENNVTIEFEGGKKETQVYPLGTRFQRDPGKHLILMAYDYDRDVEQEELNQYYMPSDYDFDNEGYYYQTFATCNNCIKEKYSQFAECILIDGNQRVYGDLEEMEEIAADIQNITYSGLEEYANHLSADLLREMNEDLFNKILNTNTFGIKKEKRRLYERYFCKLHEEITKELNIFILNSEKYKELVRKSQKFSLENDKEIMEMGLKRSYIFKKIDYMQEEEYYNLICSDMTFRKGLGTIENIQFYEGPYKFNRKYVEDFIDDKSKFVLSEAKVGETVEELKEKFIRKISKIMNEQLNLH